MNDRQTSLERIPSDLQVVNMRSGGALVKVGDEQLTLPMLTSIEREMDKVNGFLEQFRLGRIQRKKNIATHDAIAAGEVDVIRATIGAQARTLISIMDRVAKAKECDTLARLKNWVEERLHQAQELAHMTFQRSYLRVIVQYAQHLEVIRKQELPADLQDLVLGKAHELFKAAWEKMAAVEFKV